MSDQPERWDLVGAAVERRVDELFPTLAEFTRETQIGFKTIKRYFEGKPIARGDKRRALTRALLWTDDSIDRLLRGDPPIHVDDLTGLGWSGGRRFPSERDELSWLRSEVERLGRQVQDQASALRTLTGVVEALRAGRAAGGGPP
jgi:hypothetical protein